MSAELNWIFIVGCQRSGTTLTGQILGSHSNSFLIDEPDGLYPCVESYIVNKGAVECDFSGVITKASVKYSGPRGGYTCLHDISPHNIIAKAPNLTFSHDALLAFPQKPAIIFPVRDVRSVVASMLKLEKVPMIKNQTRRINESSGLSGLFVDELAMLNNDATPSHIKAALIWKIKTSSFKRFQEVGLNPLVFRYEALIEQPESVTKMLTGHCDISFEENLLKHHETLRGMGPGNTARSRSIDTSSLEKWREVISDVQAVEIADLTGELMLEVGYTPNFTVKKS